MELKAINTSEFKSVLMSKAKHTSKNVLLIEEFIASGAPVSEFVDTDGRFSNPSSALASLKDALKKTSYTDIVGILMRQGKLYFVNKELLPEDVKVLLPAALFN